MDNIKRKKEGRIKWIDQLRAISAFSVVWLHVAAQVVIYRPNISDLSWWSGNISDSFVRWSVPVFVMMSGMLVLPNAGRLSLSAFYTRRMGRILVPVFFWTVFYLLIDVYQKKGFTLSRVVHNLLSGHPYYHLWFFYAVLGLYLAAPFLSVFIKHATKAQLHAAIGISFVLASSSYLLNTVRGTQSSIFIDWLLLVPYFLAGYAINLMPLSKKLVRFCWLCIPLSGCMIAILTGLLFPYVGKTAWAIMYGALNPIVIVMSMSVFVVARYIRLKKGGLFERCVQTVSYYSLGVYAVHPVWILVLTKLGFHPTDFLGVYGIVICSVTVFLLSIITCSLISISTFGKKLVV